LRILFGVNEASGSLQSGAPARPQGAGTQLDWCRQQLAFSALLGPDRFPEVSTARSTTVVGPMSRQ
jgi:hypothetical protein